MGSEGQRTDREGMLQDAELRRVESEIARNDAERAKLTSEADEARKKLSYRWYQEPIWLKSIVGGFVAAGLFVIWYVQYFQPILERRQTIAEFDNRILAARADSQRVANLELSAELVKLQAVVQTDFSSVGQGYTDLQAAQAKSESLVATLRADKLALSRAYDSLSQEWHLTEVVWS